MTKYVIFVGTLDQWLHLLVSIAIFSAAVYFILTVRRFRKSVLIPSEKEMQAAQARKEQG
jgi:hypothetical protein